MQKIQVVSQVGIVAIGFDEPRLHVDIDMRPTSSLSDWLQRRGRTSRAWPPVPGDRSYQITGIEQLRTELRAKRNPLYVLPCGGGKSYVACQIAANSHTKNKSIGFITVRRALVADISSRLTNFGVPHGVIMPGFSDSPAKTKVASIHTLAARNLTLDVDCLFVDEAHQYLSPEFLAVLDRHAHIPKVFLTATPARSDGQGLCRLADSIVLGPSASDLIELGFLVPSRVFCRVVPDRSHLDINQSGEYNESQLASLMSRPTIVGNCVKEWLYRANNLPTIVHAVNVAHSRSIVAKFLNAGVHAVHIDADTPDDERRAAFDNMCENSPPKPTALLIDLAGNVLHFGFPEDDREWSLDDQDPHPQHERAFSVRRCEKCWYTFSASTTTCPACGQTNIPTQRQIRERAEELAELKRQSKQKAIATAVNKMDDEALDRKLIELMRTAKAKSYKPFWAQFRFKILTGHFPTTERLSRCRQQI